MMLLLYILSTILLVTTIYAYIIIRKEYGQIMVPRYVYVIMAISFLISVLCIFF
jgi:hypothetical protein